MNLPYMDTMPSGRTSEDTDVRSENIQLLQLPDGRRLSYTEFGERTGYPLIHFHSAGSSRLEAASFHQSAKQSGFRIIAIDRPGIGLSDPHRMEFATGFSHDVLYLIKHLRCSRVGLLACGGGVREALEMAALFPAKIDIFAGISCVFPVELCRETGARKWVIRSLQSLMSLSIYARHWWRAGSVKSYVARWAETLSFADQQLLENPHVRQWVEKDIAEALRQGVAGVVRETVQHWRFKNTHALEVHLPCHFWQGSAEDSLTVHQAQRFTERLSNAHLHTLPNRGRYFYLRHMESVFEKINAELGRSLREPSAVTRPPILRIEQLRRLNTL